MEFENCAIMSGFTDPVTYLWVTELIKKASWNWTLSMHSQSDLKLIALSLSTGYWRLRYRRIRSQKWKVITKERESFETLSSQATRREAVWVPYRCLFYTANKFDSTVQLVLSDGLKLQQVTLLLMLMYCHTVLLVKY